MTPSIYINLEDDVSKIVDRIKREASLELVLVCPKRCFLFNDSINLRLLKKQTDLMRKSVSILTMDERGQMYAKDAGFTLRFLPKNPQSKGMSDIEISVRPKLPPVAETAKASKKEKPEAQEPKPDVKKEAVLPPLNLEEIKQTAKKLSRADGLKDPEQAKKPPVIKTENSEAQPKLDVQENVFPFEIEEHYKNQDKKSKGWKWAVGFLVVALLMAAALVFLILPKAEIVIVPKNDMLVRDLEISFGTAIKEPDSTKLVLPATQIAEEVQLKKTLESQGKKEVGNRATGFVKIYNFTRSPLNLKAENTTLTLNGKNYSLVNDVSQLRPTGYKNTKTKEVDESTLVEALEIIAAEGGEGYNLPSGTRLEISNKVFGSKPQLLYAKTDSPIAGGTSRYLSIVSDQDISSAQEQLKKEALNQVQAKLKTQKLTLPDDAWTLETVFFEADKTPGTQSPNFGAQAKFKISGLAINEDLLRQLIFGRINQTLSGNKTLGMEQENYQLIYKTKELEAGNQLGVLSVHFQGRVWYNLNTSLDGVEKQLKGKSPEEANGILSENSEIERIDIVVSPSWQKRLPYLSNKIKILVQP